MFDPFVQEDVESVDILLESFDFFRSASIVLEKPGPSHLRRLPLSSFFRGMLEDEFGILVCVVAPINIV
jgi:hypothetical protein